MSYYILFFSSHNSACVCVCVCVCACVCTCMFVCASVQCMYRVHNGLPLHKKSSNGYMTHDVTRPTTYIRTCYVDISTCPQQRLYYIMVTLLTRHIQWSYVILVGSEGTKQMKHTLVIPPPPCTCIALCRPVREMGPHNSWAVYDVQCLFACLYTGQVN